MSPCSLINYILPNNALELNTLGFSNVQTAFYWSSSSYAGNPSLAWAIFMGDGYVGAYSKANSYYIYPVRAGQ